MTRSTSTLPGTRFAVSVMLFFVALGTSVGEEPRRERTYENRWTPVVDPRPILADYPEFVAPVEETARFEAPPLVDDENADLDVRAWRFSYNARGIIEMPNHLRGDATAVIVVHPWGIDDGQGWDTPEPAGVAFQCTPTKNRICHEHVERVVDPLLQALRPHVKLVMYSLPGREDPIRRKIYRSYRAQPSEQDRAEGKQELAKTLQQFVYRGESLPAHLSISEDKPVADYFAQFRGLDPSPRYNNAGFWELPIPVIRQINVAPADVVIYDAEGYESLKTFLTDQGIRHVLLAGYNTDMCVCSTTAGYQNLSQDFNVFLVGDATLATFPANSRPSYATNAAVSFASLKLLITQASWINSQETATAQR